MKSTIMVLFALVGFTLGVAAYACDGKGNGNKVTSAGTASPTISSTSTGTVTR